VSSSGKGLTVVTRIPDHLGLLIAIPAPTNATVEKKNHWKA
jgi:hypothetical protein